MRTIPALLVGSLLFAVAFAGCTSPREATDDGNGNELSNDMEVSDNGTTNLTNDTSTETNASANTSANVTTNTSYGG